MFGLIKMLFYSFVAVAVGVFIGTVPVGGRTIADRIVGAYEVAPSLDSAKAAAKSAVERGATASKGQATAKAAPAAPVTAGQANSPERTTPEERQALDRIIASRTAR
ncbi:MAG TPA: hypothetical protein DFS52_24750 [Myxococcales bacterium]|jgi:TctA family transporter|nr:hypothetical protein [Myxococcales bacterium]